MISLRAIKYLDSRPAVLQSSGKWPFHVESRRGNVSLLVEADHPVDGLVFEGTELTLICRTDLLEDRRFTGDSPAAYLAGLYQREGDDFVLRLRGAFAVILADHRTRTLKAWADHFGIEKLVYSSSAAALAISTDLRTLPAVTSGGPEIDLGAIQQYLKYANVPTPKTIYKGIFKLAPGHQLTGNSNFATRVYWDMSYDEDASSNRSEASWAEDTFEAVRSGVEVSLRNSAEGSLGCFLSGGTDSSSVTGLVGRLTRRSPKSFSIGFDDARYNEISYARLASKQFNSEHREYFVKPLDILTLIQKAVPAYDEPFGNSSIIPTYYCARLAAENGMTHLLAGDGGDELFGGNERYVKDQVFQRYGRLPAMLRRAFIEPSVAMGRSLTGLDFFDTASRYIRRSCIAMPDRIFSYSLTSSVPAHELFDPDFVASLNGEDPLAPARAHFSAARAANDLNRWMYLDLKLIITDNDIRKVTTMSRLAGVTTRYPLLDPTLAEFSGTIPANLKVKGNQLRYLFKKAMSNILPHQIITKSKHGFGLPYSVWVGEYQPLRDFTFDILGSARCRQRGYFRRDLLEWLWTQYETVHRTYYGDMLWVFMMLELWHTTQHDSPAGNEQELMPALPQAN